MVRTLRLAPLAAALLLFQIAPAQYDADAAEPIPRLRGTLILGGGGELPAEVYQHFVEMAGGAKARLALLGAVGAGDALRARFDGKAASLASLHATSRAEAAPLRAALDQATGVWLVGGHPADFAQRFGGTPVEDGLRQVIARGGVVGGNGAVIRALSRTMIIGGGPHAAVGAGLDLVPGAVLDDRFTASKRRNRLLGVITAQPELVGLGIDARTAMVLHHRFIDVLGAGSVYGCVAASARRPVRVERINRRESPVSQRRTRRPGVRPGRERGGRTRRGRTWQRRRSVAEGYRPSRLGDLVALSRSAQARVAPRFPAWQPQPPKVVKGSLVIVGGGGMPKGLLERFIELAGGPDAPLVYVPCDEREAISRPPRMLESWRRAGAQDVDWIHTKDRTVANSDAKLLAKLRRAKGIWFGGGRQWNLVDSYQNTTAHRLMHEVLARGGVIGGSSAGASIQAAYMVRGNSLGNLDAMAEGYETGLGFLTGVAVDQHFAQRGRLADMTGLVETYPELLGLGLDEASSIIVRGTVAEVFARAGRNVHVYDRSKPVIPGQRDHVLLSHGQRYDLAARRLLDPVQRAK